MFGLPAFAPLSDKPERPASGLAYNFIDFGSQSENLTVTSSVSGSETATINSKLTMNVVKFGVNWLFNGY